MTTSALTDSIPVHISWSSNRKTGSMPVSTTGEQSCPSTCKHKKLNTCYAKFSFLGIHWKKVSAGHRQMSYKDFLQFIRNLPEKTLWRHNQAGDLDGHDIKINRHKLTQLVNANKGKYGFTYTHKPLTAQNIDAIDHANRNGFTINVSADDIQSALDIYSRSKLLGYLCPVTVTVPEDYVEDNEQIKICPAQRTDVQCQQCQWCAIANRNWIIAFKMHGSRRKKWN